MNKKEEFLDLIRTRRSVIRFRDEPVTDEQLEKILEAGRWAPSYANSQPWTFVVVRDPEKLRALEGLVLRISLASTSDGSITGTGLGNAPVVIAVVVDPFRDPRHHVESGVAAVQNMALAAHALGLATFWAGILGHKQGRHSVEAEVKRILDVPREMRVVALLPVGVPAYNVNQRTEIVRRYPLQDIVRHDSFLNEGPIWEEVKR